MAVFPDRLRGLADHLVVVAEEEREALNAVMLAVNKGGPFVTADMELIRSAVKTYLVRYKAVKEVRKLLKAALIKFSSYDEESR